MSAAEWVIQNEDDAWDLLKAACSDKAFEALNIKFENWPILDIKLTGDLFDSNLSTKMMEGFIELQKNVNRTYAKLYYNYANSRGLTNEDKERIELFVQVYSGSAGYKVDLQQIFETFVKGVAGKMTGKQVVILAISGGLMWTGHSAWTSYLEHQKDIKGIEMKQLSDVQETTRMKIFADAIKQEPQVATIKADAEEMYNIILKASANAKTVQIPGAKIKGSEAKLLVRATRAPSQEINLSGDYRVVKIDNTNPDHFIVKVNDGKEMVFSAKLDQSVIISRDQNKKILEEALWSREPVRLMIKGIKVRDEITQATILEVMDRFYKGQEKI